MPERSSLPEGQIDGLRDYAEKCGESFLVPSEDEEGLAVARVMEKLVGWGT